MRIFLFKAKVLTKMTGISIYTYLDIQNLVKNANSLFERLNHIPNGILTLISGRKTRTIWETVKFGHEIHFVPGWFWNFYRIIQ